MLKNPYPGKFIIFEGLDGSGKSTQVDLLLEYLKKNGKKVYCTSEPTQYLIGGLIKSWVANDWKSTPECLQLLFAADRSYHLNKEITPLLKRGITVICDRYFFSSFAYGNLEIKDLDWLISINQNFILPDITFLLKVSSKICIQRMAKERFSIGLFEEEKKLEKVWQNYEKIAKRFKNIEIIDGEKPTKEVFEEIKGVIETKNLFKIKK
jgi:dTMP kinase